MKPLKLVLAFEFSANVVQRSARKLRCSKLCAAAGPRLRAANTQW
eukprot:CAMPEP_0180108050 /NCGR_PEP_ID=MMETSP0985-20121206/33650_1 /TAXON_ID=483367 /ORGANISM="non described non described, Strain CCMP 2436" /LENGTH=44 /DNA_ID= /DNA_START= /DNA_END= /DNA_ORIENTATION=